MERSAESFSEDTREKIADMRSSTKNPTSFPVHSEENSLRNHLRTSTGSCHDVCKYGIKYEFKSKRKQPHHVLSPEVSNTRKLDYVRQSAFGSSRILPSPQLRINSTSKRNTGFHTKQLVKSSPLDGKRSSKYVVGLDKQVAVAPRFQKKAVLIDSPSRLGARSNGNASARPRNYFPKAEAAANHGKKTVSSLRTKVKTHPVTTLPIPKRFKRGSSGTASAGITFKYIGISEVKEITKVDSTTNSLSPPDQYHQLSTKKELITLSQKVGIPSTSRVNSTGMLKKPQLQPIPWNSGGRTVNMSKYSWSIKVKREVKPSNFSVLNSHAPRTTYIGSRNSRNKRVSNTVRPSPLPNGDPQLVSLKLENIYVRNARYNSMSTSTSRPDIELPNVTLDTDSGQKNPSHSSYLPFLSSCSSSSWSSSSSQSSLPIEPSPSLKIHQGSPHSKSRRRRRGENRPENQVKDSGRRKAVRVSSSESEGKERGPRTVYFRRGRAVNVQDENNVPKQLRFKQRKLIEEHNGSCEPGKRNSMRRNTGKDDPNKSRTPMVVLRRQDVQTKKDTQDLNQVIEETASKLVESRKSKVRALVGAFESVISLQESKPL